MHPSAKPLAASPVDATYDAPATVTVLHFVLKFVVPLAHDKFAPNDSLPPNVDGYRYALTEELVDDGAAQTYPHSEMRP